MEISEPKWQHRSARSCYCAKQVVKKRLSFKPYPSLPADGPQLVRTLLRPSRRTSTAHRAARSEAMEISEPKWQHRSARSCYCAKQVVKKRLSFKPYPSLPADGPQLVRTLLRPSRRTSTAHRAARSEAMEISEPKWQHRSARSCYCAKQVVKKRLSFKPYPSLPADGPRLVRTLLRPSRRTSTAHRAARSEAMEISEPKWQHRSAPLTPPHPAAAAQRLGRCTPDGCSGLNDLLPSPR